MSKRTFLDLAASSEPKLTIITADGGRIQAHSEVLCLACSCLKNAPATDTWDLQQMQIEGRPVTSETVEATVEMIYHVMHVLDVAMQQDRFSLLQFRDMLLFADAVGCSKRMISSMAALIDVCCRKQLEVTATGRPLSGAAGEPTSGGTTGQDGQSEAARQHMIVVHMEHVYTLSDATHILEQWVAARSQSMFAFTEDSTQPFADAVAVQIESLLHTAFKLEAQPLISLALGFIQRHSAYSISLLHYGSVQQWGNFLTPRVLAAAGSSTIGSSLLGHVMMQVPLGPGVGIDTVFTDVDWNGGPTIRFRATMSQDLLDIQNGSRVKVTVDLLRCSLTIEVLEAEEPCVFDFGLVLGQFKPPIGPSDIRLHK